MSDQITRSIIVKGDIATVFDIWSDYETFPNYMSYVQRVAKIDQRTSQWEVAGPLGITLEWMAETTRLEPPQRIAWSTKDNDGSVTTSGEVVFAELPDSHTHLTVTMHYTTPGGKAGEALAQLFSDPAKRLEEDLRNFKTYVENGLY